MACSGAPAITTRGRHTGPFDCARGRPNDGWIASAVAFLIYLTLGASAQVARHAASEPPGFVTLSIVGTSDLHGEAFPRNGRGGLPLFAGYVNNLRAVRAADGGAVLLIDSGDTFQGNVESNLSEGAVIVDAYNALGYTAQAIGNHDFDYGAVDSPMARQLPGDLRGALKARAAQSGHPFLAANLLDAATGQPVEWPHIRRSVIVDVAEIKVGIVGVMTIDGLRSTLAVNVQGLRLAPLGPTVSAEAAKLRADGAQVVIVAAHAGGRCDRFDEPTDLSSCDNESEIFQLARNLPHGLVDVIAAGHTHAGLGHQIDGVGIIQPFSRGQSFGRVDVVVDRATGKVMRLRLFEPRLVCARQHPTGGCAEGNSGAAVEYEGRAVTPDPKIVAAMEPALRRVHELQAAPIGVALDAPIRRSDDGRSPLGDLFADALRAAVPGAEVAAINNAARLWADLPSGPLTLGRLYNVFPFDNRVVQVSMSGADLSRWLANEIRQGRQGGVGISGVNLTIRCLADGVHVELLRGTERIPDDTRLIAVTIGGPTLNGNLASPDFLGSVGPLDNSPVVREVVEDWFRRLGQLPADQRRRLLATRPAVDCPRF
jgi:2',3'-cyclic-nucleotide 2'-phosphodiesterase (5'-nucleotidase family)